MRKKKSKSECRNWLSTNWQQWKDIHSLKHMFLDMEVGGWCGAGEMRNKLEQSKQDLAPLPLTHFNYLPSPFHPFFCLTPHPRSRPRAPRRLDWRKFLPTCATAPGPPHDVRAERGGAASWVPAPPGPAAPACSLKERGLRQPRHTAGTKIQGYFPRVSSSRLPSTFAHRQPPPSSPAQIPASRAMQPAVLLGLLGATMMAGEWALWGVQNRGQRQPLPLRPL